MLVRVGVFRVGTNNKEGNNTIMGAFHAPDYFQEQGKKEEEENKSTMTKKCVPLEIRDPEEKRK